MFAERESHALYYLQEQDMTRFDAVNYSSHGIPKAAGRSEARRAQEAKPRADEEAMGAIFGRSAHRRNGGQTPVIDETKIIAAILCGQTIAGEDPASDRVSKIVDLYEKYWLNCAPGSRPVKVALVSSFTGNLPVNMARSRWGRNFARTLGCGVVCTNGRADPIIAKLTKHLKAWYQSRNSDRF